MEEQNQTQPTVQNILEVTNTEKHYLNITRKWSYFFAILGFIGVGLLVLAAIIMGTLMPQLGPTKAFGSVPGFAISALYLIFGIVYFFPALYLLRFASDMKDALYQNNQDALSSGLLNLSKVFKFMGIVTIVILALYPLMIVGLFLMQTNL